MCQHAYVTTVCHRLRETVHTCVYCGHVETLTLHVVPTHKPLALLPASDRSHKK